MMDYFHQAVLVASGRASLHHILPDTGWVTYYIRGYQDVPAVVELFRLNYDRLTASLPAGAAETEEGRPGGMSST